MPRYSSYRICRLAFALLLAVIPYVALAEMNTGRQDSVTEPKARGTEATYQVQAGLDSDIFPVFANFASFQVPQERKIATVTVTITNPTDVPIRNRVTVDVPGWSDQEIQIVEVGAGKVSKLSFAPTFHERLYQNHELTAATAHVAVADMAGKPIYETTTPVRLRSVDDLYWGDDFRNAQFIASWVTPHDPEVEAILTRAKEFMPGRRLPGYETWKSPAEQEKTTYAEVGAIYRALQQQGVSYVKSSSTFGARANAEMAERVRMPHESILQMSANCIDGVVLYASLFENLGMDPVVVLVPGHAYVGVRVADGSDKFLYVETAITGRAPYEQAVKAATSGVQRFKPSDVRRISISDARHAGVYPMPAAPQDRPHQEMIGTNLSH